MRRLAGMLVVAATAGGSLVLIHGCGPACLDDRCSLQPTKPTVTRVDYTNPSSSSGSATVSGAGSGSSVASAKGSNATAPTGGGSAVAMAAGSDSETPTPPTGSNAKAGSNGGSKAGSKAGSNAKSNAKANAGSAPPPPTNTKPAPAKSGSWEIWQGDRFKMYVITKSAVKKGSSVRLAFVKTPTKTPFVVTLKVLSGGAPASEAVWNDCPQNTIVCDAKGTKSHTTKKSGQVLVQAGINWTVTSVSPDGKGTLVTWTNNLSRETVSIRLIK